MTPNKDESWLHHAAYLQPECHAALGLTTIDGAPQETHAANTIPVWTCVDACDLWRRSASIRAKARHVFEKKKQKKKCAERPLLEEGRH